MGKETKAPKNKVFEKEPAKLKVKLDEKKPAIPQSMTKRNFEKLIEAYKKQNPVKYEQKKEALEAQLKNLK